MTGAFFCFFFILSLTMAFMSFIVLFKAQPTRPLGEHKKRLGMKKCEICGEPQKNDLFSAVTDEPVCSICKMKFIGGLPTTTERISEARAMLNLVDGEYLKQDNPAEARKILGR